MRKEGEEFMKITNSDPILRNSHDFYSMSREDMKAVQYRKIRRMAEIDKAKFFSNWELTRNFGWVFLH